MMKFFYYRMFRYIDICVLFRVLIWLEGKSLMGKNWNYVNKLVLNIYRYDLGIVWRVFD